MKRFLRSEAGAAVIWVLSALVLAAILSPWVYQAGKALAAHAAAHQLSAFQEWLGAACDRSKFGRFYSRSLYFSALVLLPALFARVKAIRARESVPLVKSPAISWQSALTQFLVAVLIAGGFLWLLGSILEVMGAYKPNPKAPAFGKVFLKVLPPALIVACLEEWLFRGLMLGLWMRFAKPLAACIGCSLIFAFMHFLEPPDGIRIANPTAATAGFELLGNILRHFTDPVFFVTDFATLFVVGMILAGARVRTGKLWFSIGLHAGWIMAFKGFGMMYRNVDEHPIHPWGVGDNLRSGVLPLLTLGVTAVVCHLVLKKLHRSSSHASR